MLVARGDYFVVVAVENIWFTKYKRTRNRTLVFHTKVGIIVYRKEGRG